MIRNAAKKDSAKIAEIYNHYILNSSITFEENPLSETEIISRIENVQNSGLPWLVAEIDGGVVGYAYATKWNDRSAYRFSVETTVYLTHEMKGNGLGTELYSVLFQKLKESGVHVAIGGITLPNTASIRLHEKLGMKKVAHFEKVGFKFNQWLDVGYWQIDLYA